MKSVTAKILLVLALGMASKIYALSGSPHESFSCASPQPFSRFFKLQCSVDQAQYTAPTASWSYPVAFIVPKAPGPHRVKVKLSGYSAKPEAFCTGLDWASDDFIVIKPCAAHYPDLSMHAIDGVRPMGWWGWYRGPSNSMRLGLSVSKAAMDLDSDMDAGIYLEGSSYGGTGAILQSMMLRQADPWWGNLISVVRADIPHTNFIKNWMNYKPVDLAWEGYNRDGADIEKQMANGSLDQIYYRVNGSPADTSVIFDLEFFRLCNQYKVACFGTWHNAGHTIAEPGINLPFYSLYAGPDMDVRLDQMLPVFTNSSANHWGNKRGHYNLGLQWHQGGYYIDSDVGVLLPIRYVAQRNIGGGIPDQPSQATFDVTVRRITNFALEVGTRVKWELRNEIGHYGSGQVTVTRKGEVTVPGLTLPDSPEYAGLILTVIR